VRLPLIILAIIVVAALIGPLLIPWHYDAIDWNAVRAPLFSPAHLLGTDSIGRDLLARTLVGTRVTLAVAIAAAFVSLVIGVAWGAVAGWAGGRLDELMMRIVDGLYALPFMFVVILLMVIFGRSIVLVFVGIGAVEWLTMARVVRGQVIVLKERPFILAAEAAGAPARAIILRHLLPNLIPPLMIQATFGLAAAIVAEGSLSFLGLGVEPPTPSWGAMLNDGRQFLLVAPHLTTYPGLALMLTVLALNLVGDALQDRLNYRNR